MSKTRITTEQVSYKPAGTGAVATDLQSKLRESVSVKDFGAVGDGVTNDTAAIQASLDSLAASGGAVAIPRGEFFITGSITVPEGVNIQGESKKASRIKQTGNFNCFVLTDNNSVKDVGFNCGNGIDTGIFAAIYANSASDLKIESVEVSQGKHALAFINCINVHISDAYASDPYRWAFAVLGCKDVVIRKTGSGMARDLTPGGATENFKIAADTDYGNCTNISLYDCYATHTLNDCIDIIGLNGFVTQNVSVHSFVANGTLAEVKSGVKDVSFVNCFASGSQSNGFVISYGANNVELHNCKLLGFSKGFTAINGVGSFTLRDVKIKGNNTDYGISVDDVVSTGSVLIDNCELIDCGNAGLRCMDIKRGNVIVRNLRITKESATQASSPFIVQSTVSSFRYEGVLTLIGTPVVSLSPSIVDQYKATTDLKLDSASFATDTFIFSTELDAFIFGQRLVHKTVNGGSVRIRRYLRDGTVSTLTSLVMPASGSEYGVTNVAAVLLPKESSLMINDLGTNQINGYTGFAIQMVLA